MYFLQEAISGGPFLLVMIVGLLALGVFIVVVLYRLLVKKNNKSYEIEEEYEQPDPPGINKAKNISMAILLVFLTVVFLAACNWLCNFKYD